MGEQAVADPKAAQAEAKAKRELFGVTGKAIQATQAFERSMNFDHADVDRKAVILVDSRNMTYTSVNLYGRNGQLKAGAGYNPASMTHGIKDVGKFLRKLAKGDPHYVEVPVESIPVAEKVEGPALVAPVATPKAETKAETPKVEATEPVAAQG